MRRPICVVCALSLGTTPARADPPGPTPTPDPLEDAAWRRDARGLRLATGTLGILAGASLVGFEVAHNLALIRGPSIDGPSGVQPEPGYEEARAAAITTGVLLIATAIGVIATGAVYDRHLERAARATVPGPRLDAAWQTNDRGLTSAMRASAALSGITGGGAVLLLLEWGDGPGQLWSGVALALASVAGLGIFTGFAVSRRRHRAGLARWPRPTAAGLTIRF